MTKNLTILRFLLLQICKLVLAALCLAVTGMLLFFFVRSGSSPRAVTQNTVSHYEVMDRYDSYVTNVVGDALEGVMSIKKSYWLSDTDLVAPQPNQDNFGETDDPSSLGWLLEEASELLEGQETVFQPDVQIKKGTVVRYYYDETILVITWRQMIDKAVYTVSEVKIADPSQFRRFLSNGEYASGAKYLTSEMAKSVNAVVASNGDYYAMRKMGTVVYNSQIMRMDGERMDSCYIDGNGDMMFLERGEMTDPEEIDRFVQENEIRFCLSFGPVLIEDGEMCYIKQVYPVGEVKVRNARAALCQVDKLHYLLVVSSQPPFGASQTLARFAEDLMVFGPKMAYNLDGGRSATLVMNNQLINDVSERRVSDIIYFATAIPDGDASK